ncbi:MAG: VOC family protein [bacterium]
MQKITPCLWFDHQAESAVDFYTSIFKDSKVLKVARYGEAGAKASGQAKGSVMTIEFELAGQRFLALNGGPIFQFSPAVSMMVHCESQAELDWFWDRLAAGGEPQRCGWLKDQFGLSWQIVPTQMGEFMQGEDPQRSARVMQAMLQMQKLDIQALKKAYEG